MVEECAGLLKATVGAGSFAKFFRMAMLLDDEEMQ